MENVNRYENRSLEMTEFLKSNSIASLATTGKSQSEIAIIFYVFNGTYIFYKSRTASNHSLNLLKDRNCAISIYYDKSNYKSKYGVQINGFSQRITNHKLMQEAVDLYSTKFEGSANKLPSISELCSDEIKSTFYSLRIISFKIVDEDEVRNRTMLEYLNF